ncbi:aldo-keto reductase family 1 member B1-like isoform X2 [Bacillus rossius redtenbacheri]|uniref:aldo-keto reductase family 1 member B1-like isoform X2 n=1 Tax=Bacillus rossius redtenbacheri TaxID=93214 RepID=UPI002FDEAB28
MAGAPRGSGGGSEDGHRRGLPPLRLRARVRQREGDRRGRAREDRRGHGEEGGPVHRQQGAWRPLWNTFHRPELVLPACKKTLENFGLDYLDLYLMHWPMAFKEGDESFPTDAEGNFITEDIDYVDTYLAMEECVRQKLTRSIGVSNFNSQQILRVLKASIKPVMNQVECHPYLNQKRLIEFCRARGIQVTGYSPLGAPNTVWAPGAPKLVEDPRLAQLAARLGRSVAQVVLRYLVQNRVIAIPKSTNPTRLKQNISVFDFQLSEEDMEFIDGMNSNTRTCPFFQCKNDKNYPFVGEF